ncbi:MAG: zinc-ribbon domain-containing protein [Clostridia bacterium]|nr:zinc-ribbon domain-containing protein [Clostridia bacterium]
MFCQKCGSQLNDGSKFCTTCGAPVAPVVQEPVAPVVQEPVAPVVLEPVAPVVQEPVAPVVLEPVTPVYSPAPEAFSYAPAADNAPAPAKKKGKKAKIIVPIIAVIVAAAIAVGAFFMFGNKKYYMSTMTQYSYDEDGEIDSTYKMVLYGKFMFPLEATYEDDSIVFELDDDNKIISLKEETEDESYSIDIEYEKEDGKQVGKGSKKSDDGEKQTIEVVYESKDEFTVTTKTDGELNKKYHCYINDDGYSVTEIEDTYSRSIFIYDGINLIEQKDYEREDEDDDFELTYSTTNEYNKAGYLIESVIEYNYDDYDESYKTVYERNKNNVPTSITWYEDGEKVRYAEVDEEEDDSITLEVFDEDDESIGFCEYGFKGKKITYEKTFDADKELTKEANYNENGLLEEEISYSDGEIYAKTVYEYEKR